MKKYAMIQIDAEIHQLLKEFCKEKGYKINGLVETLIKEKVESTKKPLPKNILPVNSKS
jgi:predicted HicB family RNase H-like nuclease